MKLLSTLRNLTAAGFAFLFAIIAAHPAQAADINVGCTAGVGDTAGLITAINTANGNWVADTINLTAGCTYSFTEGDATNSDSALPRITTEITINGNGAILERASSAATDFRLLYVTSSGNLTLDNATVTGGHANFGGGIRNEGGTLMLTNSILSGNSASTSGGGIGNLGMLTVTNSILSGNSAIDGGGIGNGGMLTVTNSTLAGNSASNSGGGIYNLAALTTLTNSIVWGNNSQIVNGSGIVMVSYSIVQGGFVGGTNIIDADPLFVAPEPFANAPTTDGDYHLQFGSPAIDAGNNADVPIGLTTDIDGEARILYGVVDIGADEVDYCPAYASPHTVPAGDTADLVRAIQCANLNPDANVISLTASTYTFTAGDATNSDSALPRITTEIIINGNGATIQRTGGPGFRLLYVDSGGDLTLNNVTVSGGSGVGTGGGIYNAGGTLMLTNATVSGNSASGSGGGIYNLGGGTVTMSNSIVSGNNASSDGAGIFTVHGGTFEVTNSTVSGNSGTAIYNTGLLTVTNSDISGNSGEGIFNWRGGINNWQSTVTVTDSDISGNSSGIYNQGGTLTVTNSTVTGNSPGGGIRNSASSVAGGVSVGGNLTVINSEISNNSANVVSGTGRGGGINNTHGTVTVTDSTISGNSAASSDTGGEGGGIWNSGLGTVTLTNSIITGNSSDGYPVKRGGGIFNRAGTVNVISSSITGNSSGEGGGIYNTNIEAGFGAGPGTVTVTDSTISGNSVSFLDIAKGGGIFNNFGTVTVTNSNLSDNRAGNFGAPSEPGDGGGIFNTENGTLTLTSSTLTGTLTGNHAAERGGGIANWGGMVTVTDSTISGIRAWRGGGIYNGGGTLTVTNSTISGNSASTTLSGGEGGGIWNYTFSPADPVTVTNSTITGNHADDWGGGIFNSASEGALPMTVTNSIVWGNSSQIANDGGSANVTYSIVEGGGFDGDGNLTDDPLFVAPVSHTLAPTTAGNYRLQADSPALNVGNNDALPPEITTDLDGNPRVVNVVVDMGAYEHQTAAAVVLSETAVSVTEGGATDSYTVRLASKPTANVTVNLSTGGQTTVSPTTLTFTPSNWSTTQPVTVTAVDDTAVEGPHDDTITHSASSTDAAYDGISADASVSVTDDELPPGELLENGGFELDNNLDKVPDGWTLKNATKDKLKCNTPDKLIAFEGECAFKFKGGVPERAKLIQNVDFSSVTLAEGDTLSLSAYFNGSNTAVKAKFILKVSYVGSDTPSKESETVGPQAGYTLVGVPELSIEAGTVEQVKVMMKHKSTAGKLYVDSASLIHTPVPARGRSDVLPVPSAPDGFRGGN